MTESRQENRQPKGRPSRFLQSSSQESPACAGGCTGQDPDGDVITSSWDGLDGGGWELEGGTGKWSGASGAGTWMAESPMGAGFTRNTWSGSIEME